MNVNKHVIIATAGLMAVGVIKKVENKDSVYSTVFIGGFIFMLALSVADLFGGNMSKLASGLAYVALINGILTEIPPSFLTKITTPPGTPGTQPPPGGTKK